MKTQTSHDDKPVLSSRCPKCGKTTPRAVAECKHCGIIYSRYLEVQRKKQARLKQQQVQAEQQQSSRKGVSLVQLLLVVAITFGGTYYYFNSKNKTVSNSIDNSPALSENVADRNVPAPIMTQPTTNPPTVSNQVISQPIPANAGDVIARARKATVSLETPFGTGSGFFISSNYIITNKHVVEVDQQEVERLRGEIEPRQQLIDLERKKLTI